MFALLIGVAFALGACSIDKPTSVCSAQPNQPDAYQKCLQNQANAYSLLGAAEVGSARNHQRSAESYRQLTTLLKTQLKQEIKKLTSQTKTQNLQAVLAASNSKISEECPAWVLQKGTPPTELKALHELGKAYCDATQRLQSSKSSVTVNQQTFRSQYPGLGIILGWETFLVFLNNPLTTALINGIDGVLGPLQNQTSPRISPTEQLLIVFDESSFESLWETQIVCSTQDSNCQKQTIDTLKMRATLALKQNPSLDVKPLEEVIKRTVSPSEYGPKNIKMLLTEIETALINSHFSVLTVQLQHFDSEVIHFVLNYHSRTYQNDLVARSFSADGLINRQNDKLWFLLGMGGIGLLLLVGVFLFVQLKIQKETVDRLFHELMLLPVIYTVGIAWPFFLPAMLPELPVLNTNSKMYITWVVVFMGILLGLPLVFLRYLTLKPKLDVFRKCPEWLSAFLFAGIGMTLGASQLLVGGTEHSPLYLLLPLNLSITGYAVMRFFSSSNISFTSLWFILSILSGVIGVSHFYTNLEAAFVPILFAFLLMVIYVVCQSLKEDETEHELGHYIPIPSYESKSGLFLQEQNIQCIRITGNRLSGKTAFYQNYIKEAFIKSGSAECIECVSDSELPFSALAPLLKKLGFSDEENESTPQWAENIKLLLEGIPIFGLIRDIAEDDRNVSVDPDNTIQELIRRLIDLAGRKKVLLFCKHVEWYDEASLNFIATLRNTLSGPSTIDKINGLYLVITDSSAGGTTIPQKLKNVTHPFKEDHLQLLNWTSIELHDLQKKEFEDFLKKHNFDQTSLAKIRVEISSHKQTFRIGQTIEYIKKLQANGAIQTTSEGQLSLIEDKFDLTEMSHLGSDEQWSTKIPESWKDILRIAAILAFGRGDLNFNLSILCRVMVTDTWQVLPQIEGMMQMGILSFEKKLDDIFTFKNSSLKNAILKTMDENYGSFSIHNPTLRHYHHKILETYQQSSPLREDLHCRVMAIHSRYYQSSEEDWKKTFQYNLEYAELLFQVFNTKKSQEIVDWLFDKGDTNFLTKWLQIKILLAYRRFRNALPPLEDFLKECDHLPDEIQTEWTRKTCLKLATCYKQNSQSELSQKYALRALNIDASDQQTLDPIKNDITQINLENEDILSYRGLFYFIWSMENSLKQLKAFDWLENKLNDAKLTQNHDSLQLKAELLDAAARATREVQIPTKSNSRSSDDPIFEKIQEQFLRSLNYKQQLHDYRGSALSYEGLGSLFFFFCHDPDYFEKAEGHYQRTYEINVNNHFFRGLFAWMLGRIQELRGDQNLYLAELYYQEAEIKGREPAQEIPQLQLLGLIGLIRIYHENVLKTPDEAEQQKVFLLNSFNEIKELLKSHFEITSTNDWERFKQREIFKGWYETWDSQMKPLQNIANHWGVAFDDLFS